ncbi:acyl-CoA thioesterase [Leifsonia sp. YAF41]|uniref:acyl-CoA thioesterase n=1 Tax=Leifsonia sp. YAF41 TaxID=3233086 RepID=UPI003F962254
MTATSGTFLAAVTLREVPAELYDRAFIATSQYVPWPKAYGGDMVAQAASAAMATVSDDRSVHSMHSYFLRPVDIDAEVRYEVEVVRDGRGYSTRHVRGMQNGKGVYLCIASFHVQETSGEYQPTMPSVTAPDDLPSSAEHLVGVESAAADYWSTGRSFDHRHVDGPVYLTVDGEHTPHQAVWVKAFDRLDDDPALHRAAIAYVCDYTILEPMLRVQGIGWAEPGLVTASLDHSMWFHREARADEWLLYVQELGSLQNGRGLGIGRFFDRAGHLVATVAQEGMIRQTEGKH